MKANRLASLAIIALLALSAIVAAAENPFNKGWQEQIGKSGSGHWVTAIAQRTDSDGNPRGACVWGVNRYTDRPIYGSWARYSDGTYKCVLLKSFCKRYPDRCD